MKKKMNLLLKAAEGFFFRLSQNSHQLCSLPRADQGVKAAEDSHPAVLRDPEATVGVSNFMIACAALLSIRN